MEIRIKTEAEYEPVLTGFDCGKPALNEWFLRQAKQSQGSGSAKTFLVRDAARLAVAKADQGLGVGRGMLQDAIRRTFLISEHAGIRAMLTHPIEAEAEMFYLRSGFQPSPLRKGQLVLLLKDARKLV
jgi:GNAT superfamily N-acetyltransferase